MLLDAVLATAPILIVLAAAEKLPRTPYTYATRRRQEKRLDNAMRLAAKVPSTVAGYRHIAGDVDRQALRLAYAIRYPQRAGEVINLLLLAGLTLALAITYTLVLIADGPGLYLVVLLVLQVVAMLWFRRATGNFTTNDELNYELFVRFGAPERLHRRDTDLVGRMSVHTADAVLARAADIRDAEPDAISTLAAVNQVLAQSHAHGAWQAAWEQRARAAATRVTETDYRGYARSAREHTVRLTHTARTHAKTQTAKAREQSASAQVQAQKYGAVAQAQTVKYGGTAYDWTLRRVVGPIFDERLKLIDDREHLRVRHAERSGDIFKAAWLRAHYRAERTRVLAQWQAIHQRNRVSRHPTS